MLPACASSPGTQPPATTRPAPQAQVGPPAPPPLTLDQQLANLVAYAKLLGYVRYFHPSDEAAAADWEALAVGAVPRIEGARSPEELAAALQASFAPVAPTLRVYPAGHAPPAPPELAAAQPTWTSWVHFGLGDDPNDENYTSVRATNVRTPHPHPARLVHDLDAKAVAGKRVHAKARVRATPADAASKAMLVVEWRSIANGPVRTVSQAVTTKDWQEVEVVADIPARTKHVAVGLLLDGDGAAGVDHLSAVIEGDTQPLALSDPATAPEELKVAPLPVETIPRPADDVFHATLGGGVEANVPMSLYVADGGRTLPVGALVPEPVRIPAEQKMARYSATDRAVRLADVALAWNVFEHFYPYSDVAKTDWVGLLPDTFAHAIADRDEKSFHTTLKRLVAAAHDGHGAVWREVYDARDGNTHGIRHFFPPLSWRVVEGKLVVTAAAQGAADVKVGDVVTAIDDKPADRALADAAAVESAATPQYTTSIAAESLLGGAQDGTMTLKLSRGTEVTVKRTEADLVHEARPPVVTDLAPGVVYVDVTRATNAEVAAAMPRLLAARGIVVDVRGYPRISSMDLLRHLADAPMHSPQFLTPKIVRPDHDAMQFLPADVWTLAAVPPRMKAKVAFLTDARAISYGETWMGFVQAYKLGAIVGSPTAGTNGVRNEFALPGGYVVAFTGMKVLNQDGSQLFGAGIAPTVPCAPTVAGVAAGTDEVLACGIAAVK
jgi:C-terminal processing protease CtpA/Prc